MNDQLLKYESYIIQILRQTMQIEEKEMDLEKLEAELILAEYDYRDIRDVNFTPINKAKGNNIRFGAFIITLVVLYIIFSSKLPSDYQFLIALGWALLLIILYNIYPLTLKKFLLSDFSIDDLKRIKSDQFLLSEFKKHLVDNSTAVSAEFTKIAKNYRDQLLYKTEHLSNLKSNLERENLIKSMQ